MRPLSTGIFGVVGVPGSGKSLCAVREITRILQNHERPVYTNIPIVWSKMRAWIYVHLPYRYGHAKRRRRANLVRPVDERHFRAFCNRLAEVDGLYKRLKCKHAGRANAFGSVVEFNDAELVRRAMKIVARLRGEPILTGVNADWVPPGSVLMLDELHKWFSSKDYREEPKEILAFTSMHRHMQLKVFVLTQRWGNVSLSFRSMAEEIWTCMNYSKVPVVSFLRLGRLLNIFRYQHWNGEDWDERGGKRMGSRPIWSELFCPEWRGGREYRLYRSHSHLGTLEDQNRQLRQATAAMTGERLSDEDLQPRRKKVSELKNPNTPAAWFNRISTLVGICLVCFACVKIFGPAPVGSAETPDTESKRGVTPSGESVAVGVVDVVQQEAEPVPFDWLGSRLQVVDGRGVKVDGQRLRVGRRYEDRMLLATDVEQGRSVWVDREGRLYDWRPGGVPELGVSVPRTASDRASSGDESGESGVAPATGPASGIEPSGLRP